MTRYIEGLSRGQSLLLPECVDDYVDENNPVRVIDAFVDQLNLVDLGFERTSPAQTGRPAYHPVTLLKLYIYGYLNRVPSSCRLEREAQRNLELIWLLGHLAPDFKTIAVFRRDNCAACAIKARCTTGKERRVKRWEHEDILDAMQKRLDQVPQAMALRRQTAEHPFGTLKAWMGPRTS